MEDDSHDETTSSDWDDFPSYEQWTWEEWLVIANPANHHALEPLARDHPHIESANGTENAENVSGDNSRNRSLDTRLSPVVIASAPGDVGADESLSDYSEELSDSDEEWTLQEWLEISDPANHYAFDPLAPIRKNEE